MKANELMVGDWFRFSYTIDGKEIVRTFRISQIENELGKYYVWGNGFGRMCYPDRLEPIPITPEILEKNGFQKQGFDGWEFDYVTEGGCLLYVVLWMCDYPKEYHTHLTIESYSADFGSFKSFKIDSVHELQHALRLCGIEKEIELC